MKTWMTRVNALDSGKRALAWISYVRGGCTGPAPAGPPFVEHGIQGAREILQLESETPTLIPPHSGHCNSLTQWELRELFSGLSSCRQIVHSSLRATHIRRHTGRLHVRIGMHVNMRVRPLVVQEGAGTRKSGRTPLHLIPHVCYFYQKFLWNLENPLLWPVLKYYYVCGKTKRVGYREVLSIAHKWCV